MTIRYRVHHETTYTYGAPVVTSHNLAHLKPRQMARQAVWQLRLDIDPEPDTVAWRRDYFGNDVVYFDLERPHDRLRLAATSTIDVRRMSPPEIVGAPPWETVASDSRTHGSAHHREAFPFLLDSTLVWRCPGLEEYARPSFPSNRSVVDAVLDLSGRIYRDFAYDDTATHVATPLAEVLEVRRGVCQDFAHVMIGCLRAVGVPARYMSGYVPATGGLGLPGATEPIVGSNASHAWVAAYCGRLGWVEVDPTNDMLISNEHMVLGWGRDYDDVSPVKGVTLGGSRSDVSVTVRVERMS